MHVKTPSILGLIFDKMKFWNPFARIPPPKRAKWRKPKPKREKRREPQCRTTYYPHYQNLGISKHATPKQIKDARKELARRIHPDKIRNPAKKEVAKEAMILVDLANEVLMDPEKYKEWAYSNYYQISQTQKKWDEAHPEVPPGFKPQLQSFVNRNYDLIQKEVDALRRQSLAIPAENLTFIAPCKKFVVEVPRRKAPGSKLLKAYEHWKLNFQDRTEALGDFPTPVHFEILFLLGVGWFVWKAIRAAPDRETHTHRRRQSA